MWHKHCYDTLAAQLLQAVPEALAHRRTRMALRRREVEVAANSTRRLKTAALASKRAAMACLYAIWLGGGWLMPMRAALPWGGHSAGNRSPSKQAECSISDGDCAQQGIRGIVCMSG